MELKIPRRIRTRNRRKKGTVRYYVDLPNLSDWELLKLATNTKEKADAFMAQLEALAKEAEEKGL